VRTLGLVFLVTSSQESSPLLSSLLLFAFLAGLDVSQSLACHEKVKGLVTYMKSSSQLLLLFLWLLLFVLICCEIFLCSNDHDELNLALYVYVYVLRSKAYF
jgi:hypothetical protein